MPQIKPPKGFRKGKAKSLSTCCREIRISSHNVLGQVIDGISWYGGEKEYEKVMIIKTSKTYKQNETIVVELIEITD